MIRIICTECKNAYLQKKGDKLICPSCEATFNEELENLILGVQYYNEENYTEADNCLMKYIVKNGAEPLAVVYKALCDARSFDEDTVSLEDTYQKILGAFTDVTDDDFPEFIEIANDETEKIEKALAESHVRLFADADAENIKKEVANILNIQNEAKAFRGNLAELVAEFNERNERKISAKFSDCFYVEKEIAADVGDVKHQKICDNIASHTVFTGILTNDIKNLEIYYRCIVMFFQKSHDKYEFLLAQAEKFTALAELLEKGQYNTIKGTGAIADKLKTVSYEFLQESYKEHFDEQIDMQTETVVIIEPEIVEEPVIEEVAEESATEAEESQETVEATEDVPENSASEEIQDVSVEDEDINENDEIIEISSEENTEEELANIISADDNIIEIEVAEPAVEEAIEEIEDISSTSEIVEIPETTDETMADETETVEDAETVEDEDTVSKEETSDEIIEIEKQPQYEVVECNIPEVNNDEEIVVEEVVLEETVEAEPKKEKKKKSKKGLVAVIIVIVLAGLLAGYKYGPNLINGYKYDKAVALSEEGNYAEAITIFKELGDYSDSQEKATECEYNSALKFEEDGKYSEAKVAFENLGDYGDSKTRAQACAYSEAKAALESKNFDTASKLFIDLGDYGDSKEMVKECSYRQALSLMENKEYESAIEILTAIRKYSDAADKISEAKYMYVTDNFDKENKTTVKYLNELTTASYRNSADLRKELLGSAEVTSTDVKAFVNYSSTDLETSLTQLDNTKPIYFHVVVGDKALYGQTLTLKYTTAFGYTQRKTITLSESDNVAVMSYPATQHKNYTVEFELLDSNGKKVAGQKISF